MVRAQTVTASEPDYSKVNDFLDGRRTLLAINDLEIGGLVLPTSDGTKIDDKSIYTLPGYDPKLKNPAEIFARMFDSPIDTLVYAQGSTIYAVDPVSKQSISLGLDVPADELRKARIATGDFRGDGFNEIVLVLRSGVRIISAVNPFDFSRGLQSGPVWKRKYGTKIDSFALAVGDFHGDGRREVVIGYQDIASNTTLIRVQSLRVDQKTFRLDAADINDSFSPISAAGGSAAAGRFGSTLHDQLILAYYSVQAKQLQIRSFDFDSSLRPVLKHHLVTDLPAGGEVVLKTGRFDPNSPYDQVAMKYNLGRDNVRLGIVTFDNTLKFRLPNFTVAPVACSTPGLAVGNFSRTEPIPQDPSKMQISFKLQLAIETDNCGGRDMGLNIFNVNPPSSPSGEFTVERTQAYTNTTNDPTWLMYLNAPIIAGDVQGRSFILGDPSKVVMEDTDQPSVIAAMPPMHVDFIPPVGSNQPEELNLSAISDGFRTLYETTSSEKFESSTVDTTSWSFGARQSVGSSVEVGDVEAGLGGKVSAATRAAQDLKGIAEKEHGSYTANDFSVHLKTGFSDHVWFTSTRFNIYVYPVIGRKVCPAAKPNCGNNEKVPLTIQYSAPDFSSYEHVDGKLIPWYQPAWEPGNVLSYPANYAQLQQAIPAIDKLSADHTWRTDGSTLTEETKWTTQATDGSSASFDQNYSFEYDLSVVGACCGRLVTGTVSAELNLSGSFGFTNLNKAVATVGKSTGIGVEKPGTFLTPTNYNYPVTPYIFGQPNPPNLVDKVPLDGDVETAGILRTAFVADPARNNAGGWWREAYSSAPDVALNHPSRWEIESLGLENPIPPNCRQVGSRESTMDCAVLGPSFPNKPWNSLFHIMRGFFISSALNPGKGPQLTTAKAGDKLTLQARVYNYSFGQMRSDTEVHVRFYVQPVDNLKVPVGNSRLINDQDVVLSPIPPFSDDDGAPVNWVLASTTFDTTPYANQYLTFWVVVWMQSPGGQLVKEIVGHGLELIPGTLNSIADVKTEKYSNNVGFYNSEFYVFPQDSVEGEPSPSAEPATVAMDALQLSDCHAARGQVIDASTLISAENNSASGVTAIFYDGDPHAGGTAFGVERAPYVAENGLYKVEAPYYASACGTHEIFVVVHEGSPNEVSRKSALTVDCTASKTLN
ncbi:MAG: hypothetical protein JOY53_17160 [Acidobacteriaceae bacterium]|nr:hypothetical protein [Acidobacteriaceae bacterium]